MNITKSSHFARNFATESDILLHEIAHIVVSEYYRISVLRLHFDPENEFYKIDTDGQQLTNIQNKIAGGEPLKKYKKYVRKHSHILLAGEVLNRTYEYGWELDSHDIYSIQNTPEGKQTLDISSDLFTFSELADETLIILKNKIARINSLYEILYHETKKSKIVNIPPPEPQATIPRSLWNILTQWIRSLCH